MGTESSKQLKLRFRRFAVDLIKILGSLPESRLGQPLILQLIRSSCSAGANFRASQRPRSTADMIAKLKIVEEELDESMFWMELLVESQLVAKLSLKPAYLEANELLAIVVASIRSLRSRPSSVKENLANYGSELDELFQDEPGT